VKSVGIIFISSLLCGCMTTRMVPVQATASGMRAGIDVGEVIEYIKKIGIDWPLTGAMILGIAAGAAGYWVYDEATDSGDSREAAIPATGGNVWNINGDGNSVNCGD